MREKKNKMDAVILFIITILSVRTFGTPLPSDSPEQRLMTWFASYGGETSNLNLIQRDGGYHLVSTDFISKGGLLMQVPYDIIISDKTIDEGIDAIKSRKKRKAFRKIKDREARFIVFCLFEMSKGKRSKWAPFFDILKEHVTISLPRTFSETELNALQDELAITEANRRQNVVIEEFGKYTSQLRTIFKSSPHFERYISLEHYMRWEAKIKVRLLQ